MTTVSDIPKVFFKEDNDVGIEVMSFNRLYKNLSLSKDHSPYSFHKIQFYIILILTNKSYTHFVDFKSHKLSKGSAIFIAKNQIHHFDKTIKSCDGICIIFNSTFLDKSQFYTGRNEFYRLFNYHIEKPTIHPKEMGQDNFIDIALKMLHEYSFPASNTKSEILSSLLRILLLKAERAKEIQTIHGIKPNWLEIFSNFKTLVESQYTETRSSRYYAKELFISYKLLNEIVKKLTGKTVKTFIDDFVIIEIKRYLTSTSLTIKEISFKTGFEEPANLIKFFKKSTETTPLKFRSDF